MTVPLNLDNFFEQYKKSRQPTNTPPPVYKKHTDEEKEQRFNNIVEAWRQGLNIERLSESKYDGNEIWVIWNEREPPTYNINDTWRITPLDVPETQEVEEDDGILGDMEL